MPAWLHASIALAVAAPPRAVPFEFIKSHIFVEATLNGRKGHWLVDTGANTTVISSRAAAVARCPEVQVKVASDPYGIAKFVSVADLAVGATRADLPVVGVLPRLSDRVLKTDGVFIDGILGFDWLKKFRVQIDYKGRKLRLDPHGTPAMAARNRAIIPMEVFNGVPMIPVSINSGPRRQCLIDTGANVVSIRWDMAKASGIRPGDPGLQVGPRVRGLVAAENTSAVLLKRMNLGGVVFSNVPVSLYQESQLPWMFGKIGNGLFEAFRVTFDARNKQVILER